MLAACTFENSEVKTLETEINEKEITITGKTELRPGTKLMVTFVNMTDITKDYFTETLDGVGKFGHFLKDEIFINEQGDYTFTKDIQTLKAGEYEIFVAFYPYYQNKDDIEYYQNKGMKEIKTYFHLKIDKENTLEHVDFEELNEIRQNIVESIR